MNGHPVLPNLVYAWYESIVFFDEHAHVEMHLVVGEAGASGLHLAPVVEDGGGAPLLLWLDGLPRGFGQDAALSDEHHSLAGKLLQLAHRRRHLGHTCVRYPRRVRLLLEPEGDVEGGLVRADSDLRNEFMGMADGLILLALDSLSLLLRLPSMPVCYCYAL